MRPRNLRLKGFTSFRDEQELDFTDLDLFVLWGPTGSGKSSLLDAMTYALFGYVERVGNQVSQLVSHGQPRLSVTFEFAVEDDIYRVTRSTGHGGQSKALLERRAGDSWESFGEGADSVRELNRRIPELIGLDYEAFTRSVVLPQGKFAEFLSGDAAKRREILTDLLGLELFKRMSQRANEISRDAKTHFETKTELLIREYAGVDEASLKAAKAGHTERVELSEAAETLEKTLANVEKRWVAAESARRSLESCARDVSEAASTFEDVASSLERLAKNAAEAARELTAATKAEAEARRKRQTAAKKRATAEGKWGSLEELAGMRATASSAADAAEDVEEALTSVKESEAEVASAEKLVAEAASALSEAEESCQTASKDLQEAEAQHDEAHRGETVGSLVEGLSSGDPCPVCERPLENLPKASRKAITAAKKALDSAKKAAAAADAKRAAAQTALALARQDLAASKKSLDRCRAEVKTRKLRLDKLRAEIAAFVDKGDPSAQIDKLISDLRSLVEAEEEAEAAEDEAARELERCKVAASRLGHEIERASDRMKGVQLQSLCARVSDAAPEVDVIDPIDEAPKDPSALAALASSKGKELSRLTDELQGLQVRRAAELDQLIDEAAAALPEEVTLDLSDISAVVTQVRAQTLQLKADAALAEKNVKDLEDRLTAKKQYESEIVSYKEEHTTYRDLGRELRSDSIVQFLQAEALVALAQAASEHLKELSGTRYRLSYEEDKFYVIDAWNGDERRNVRTLSGGETFQASLALALALSEQVQLLSVSERGRLESLFLDEGFDTQDREHLDLVAATIEKLAGDGRLVGIITHVPELADQIPVRFEVKKSQRGSSLTRSTEELFASGVTS